MDYDNLPYELLEKLAIVSAILLIMIYISYGGHWLLWVTIAVLGLEIVFDYMAGQQRQRQVYGSSQSAIVRPYL